jgi:threonine-phosphate decarboxylase
MLERFGHGGDWVTATETFGYPLEKWLDFSANINPLGPPKGLKELLFREWDHLIRYPDPEVRELRTVIAQKYQLDMRSILVGNGAAELIDLIVRCLRPEIAAVVDPTFSEYAEAMDKVNATVLSIPSSIKTGFAMPFNALMEACEKVDLLFLGQPNNPTGQWMNREQLLSLLKKAEIDNTLLVLDEAFIDFLPDETEISLIREAQQSHHLAVIRSMTKFYAIPGLRLGYVVAHPDRIDSMKRLQVPWSVNHLAQKAGVLALTDHEYELQTRKVIAEERAWLAAELRKLGFTPYEGAANFILVQMGRLRWDASTLQQRLAERGILIRRCANFIGLDDDFFRIAVRTRADNERLLENLRAMLNSMKRAE